MPSEVLHEKVEGMPRETGLDGYLEHTAVETDAAVVHWSWLRPGHPEFIDQHEWDQTMYILEGTYEVTLSERDVYVCEAGDVLYIPGGVHHAGRVLGDEPIAVLQVFAPAREDYRALARNAVRRLRVEA